jgi:hypothetical protein
MILHVASSTTNKCMSHESACSSLVMIHPFKYTSVRYSPIRISMLIAPKCSERIYIEKNHTRDAYPHTVHRSRVDPRKECESFGNVRFRERKLCSLLTNVKTFAPHRMKSTRLLQSLKCPMFVVRLWITTSLYRWPIGSLLSTYMLPPHCTKDVRTPHSWSVDSTPHKQI